ncbi:hypothetical protein LguiB_032365 [Lonicera macranthoides]
MILLARQNMGKKYDDLGENKWYFFTPRDRKYKYGTRPNRAAGNGYWKASSIDRCIKYMGQTVGYKKTLVFYEGKSPKGIKTNWIMRECRINDAPAHARSSADDLRLASGEDKSIKEEDKDEAELVGSSYKGIELIGSSKNDERVVQLYVTACAHSSNKTDQLALLESNIYVFLHWRGRRKARKDLASVDSTVGRLLRISCHELYRATAGFSPQNLIGSGSFGSIYKGKLNQRD